MRNSRPRSRPHVRGPATAVIVAGALLLAGCGGQDDGGEPAADAPDTTEEPATGDDGAEDGDEVAEDDRDRYEEEARALLGLPEDEVEEDQRTRIVRRGDEELPATMDLSPGRRNVELDEDDTGTYVVTRVIVEVADGDPVVVE